MSLATLNNGDSGLEARTKINAAIAAVNVIAPAPGLPRSYISGFKLTYTGSNVIQVDQGVCRDDTDTYDIITGLYPFTKVLYAVWSSGFTAGGMDGSTWAQNTNYSVWAIYNPTTKNANVLISASATAPTLPSGYTAKRRIGWVRSKPSTLALIPWVQMGQITMLNSGTTAAEYNAGVPVVASDTLITVNAPPRVIAQLQVNGRATAAWSLSIDATDGLTNGGVTTAARATLAGAANVNAAGQVDILTSASSQIVANALGGTVTTQITCRGWIDTRGRDD